MRNVSYVHRIDTPVLAVQREQRLRLSERSHIMYCRQGRLGISSCFSICSWRLQAKHKGIIVIKMPEQHVLARNTIVVLIETAASPAVSLLLIPIAQVPDSYPLDQPHHLRHSFCISSTPPLDGQEVKAQGIQASWALLDLCRW